MLNDELDRTWKEAVIL